MMSTTPIANVEAAAAWDGDEGAEWARDWKRYDAAASGFHQALLGAAAISPKDLVLDVGCGNGLAARDAARQAEQGAVLGIDLSSQMIARARQLAAAEGVENVSFEQADAQTYVAEARYDVALSRFGTMFFVDMTAAFANIGRLLRPGGRLAMATWRSLEHNEWLREILRALGTARPLPGPQPGAPGPLSLSDSDRIREVLVSAGFERVEVEAVEAPMRFAADAESAFAAISTGSTFRGWLGQLDDRERAETLAAVQDTMNAHDTGDGVMFASAAWVTTARTP